MSKTDKIQGVRGMNDVLPADAPVVDAPRADTWPTWLGLRLPRIRTPILEHTRLFVRGIGEVTDIVEKEMYTFTDALNGEEPDAAA
jgi:histidyl-tRNA synthetase